MQEKKEKGCKYERKGYKCNRDLYDDEYCIFHSYDIEAKKDKFDIAFLKEYKKQEVNERFDFIGFVFPESYNLEGMNLRRADLQGAKLEMANLKRVDLQEANLQNADLEESILQKANLQEANLRKAIIQKANLHGANLQKARLDEVNLQESDIREANIQETNLQGAKLQNSVLLGVRFNEADLQGTDFEYANLQGAFIFKSDLRKAKLHEADLQGADINEANFQGADFTSSDLKGATLHKSSLKEATVKKIKFDRSTKCIDIDVTQAKGSISFVRFVKDQEYLDELKSTRGGKCIYNIWCLFADCGRSILRWSLWSILFALVFAFIYHNIFYLDDPTYFKDCPIHYPCSGLSFIYYSVVTFTTLGFGDIVPKPGWMQFWVMFEVILGYIMLGGLISIFSNKLARRS